MWCEHLEVSIVDDEVDEEASVLPLRGRPRDPGLTGRLLAGALDLVADQGMDRFSADALVAATGAGKAAIYRRWSNSTLLMAEAVRSCRPIPSVPDTGDLREDLIALLEPLTRALGRDEQALAAVLGHARHNPDLREGLEVAVVQPLDAAVTTVVTRHTAQGHEVTAAQLALVCRLVLALWWERYITLSPISTDAEVGALVDRALLPALGA